MKRTWMVIWAAALCLAFATPGAMAAEKKSEAPKNNQGAAKKNGAQAAQVTQCELARLLVQVLSLSRFLPASPTCEQCFSILMDNAISPKDGWVSDAPVIKRDLARVIVQAMKKQGEVEDQSKDADWEDYLKSLGVSLDSVGESVDQVEPLAEPVAPNVFSARTDPLLKRHKFNPADEQQYGVDMEFIMRVITQLELAPLPTSQFVLRPVTPD
jgi:hypothetical protein